MNASVARSTVLGWVAMLATINVFIACERGDPPVEGRVPSASAPSSIQLDSSAQILPPPPKIIPPETHAPLHNLSEASASAIGEALRSVGWTLVGSREGSVKGAQCTTVLASRDGQIAEIKMFRGYPDGLKDMLELKGTAQGFGEMVMLTVIVKGDATKTDHLYEQLTGSPPTRHGTGLGNSAE